MIAEQKKEIRKHYIDNLRNATILLLFPVHTFNKIDSGCQKNGWNEINCSS